MHTNETLYVITPIFNPFRYKSRIDLYRKFERYIEFSGAVLITVEVAWDGRVFEVTRPHNKHHVQLRTNSIMWHKESAINVGLDHLKNIYPNAKKVAWIDADVSFTNPHWVEETLFELDHYDVVQLFSESQSLNPKHVPQWRTPSLFFNYVKKVGFSQHPPLPLTYCSGGHPGLAWAAKIKVLEELGGLLDVCVHGSGDTHMAYALMGETKYAPHLKQEIDEDDFTSKGYREAIEVWKKKCDQVVKKNIGFINGVCLHYWHGRAQKRGYEKRFQIIQFHQFDPNTDLIKSEHGLYEWAGNKPNMVNDLRLSLIERNEDGTDE